MRQMCRVLFLLLLWFALEMMMFQGFWIENHKASKPFLDIRKQFNIVAIRSK